MARDAWLGEDIARLGGEPPLPTSVPASWGAYRGFRELLEALDDLASKGARGSIVGRSVLGEPIVRLEVGPSTPSSSALVLAGLHAMEWIGVEVALALVDLALRSGTSSRLVVYPLLNPDGYRRVEANLRARRFRFVRANANGVDLNRNWPTRWRPRKPLPERWLSFLGTPGSSPGSEPEVAAVLRELEGSSASFARAVSLHSFGGVLVLPRSVGSEKTRERAALEEQARQIARGFPRPYAVRRASSWVPVISAHGMEIDHLEALGIAALLVECAWGQLSIRSPSSWLHPWRWFNPAEPKARAREIAAALFPFLEGEFAEPSAHDRKKTKAEGS